jgi:cytochrome P450
MQLALYEMKIVLATLLQRFELEVVDPARATPTRRIVTMAPSGGLPMRVVARVAR